ncbi:bifunctional riboflavin kinase/FAD synthetase [Aureimonas populi]|uniref:Riboflavin biosynthesis protein n=1 Tax=Aureimonas populi TaxID=1701758 RepID=A0ABW5CHN4_9HYPH|nr:bifunctional riboflavin kinase/FAD synthetase [Aureimonas populi]
MSPARFTRIFGESALPAHLRGGVVAIGNFDGVHRGHQAVLASAGRIARERGLPLLALTFEPHPRTLFQPGRPVPRLTPAPLKARLLRALGFSAVVEQDFTRDFAALTAAEFVSAVLVRRLGAAHVVAGFDFGFGARRGGDPAYLRAAGEAEGFGVTIIEAHGDEGGVVSSSRIREDLAAGDVAGAAGLLGWRWTVEGEIGHGRKLGRTLGYPTANMALPFPALLQHGIYAVRLRRAGGALHGGVASYGRRPTFDDGAPLFETFLFDFSGDLYGETVSVSIFRRLRGEEKFADVAALVARMDEDAAEGRALLAAAEPLSDLDRAIAF